MADDVLSDFRPRAARRSAALCAAVLLGFVSGLHHYTAGFEVWTFEGLRQTQARAGELRASEIAWNGSNAPPWQNTTSAPPAAHLVDFIYTRCPSVCRTLGSEYQQMQTELSAQANLRSSGSSVRLVSISFDVEHDSPTRLREFASSVHADAAVWTFALPASAHDSESLLRSLGVVVVPDGLGGFVHNGSIHLLDASGRLRGLFESEQWPQALAAARELVAQAKSGLP